MKRLLALALALLAAALALLGPVPAGAQGALPVPELTGRVIDQTGTLDAAQRQALEERLAGFERQKGAQIVMLLVPTTQPEDIAAYANRVANAWKIGRREVGDGVLLVVAKNDRKVRIEVAKTLEGAVPDLAARQIIDEAITPRFRQGDFAGGLQGAADQLIARISGEALPAPAAQAPSGGGFSSDGFDWFDLAIFAFFAVPIGGAILRAMFGRGIGSLLTGAGMGAIALVITSSVLVAVIASIAGLLFALLSSFGSPRIGRGGTGGGSWSSGGSSGGSWSSGDSGGFSSGGGGDFGGGGASGDW